MDYDFNYFPGCASHSSARDQHLSTLEVCKALEIKLTELTDWSCCGATPGHTVGGDLAFELSAKNLASASKNKKQLTVSCASCFNNLKKASNLINSGTITGIEGVPEKVTDVVSMVYLLSTSEITNKIRSKTQNSLKGIRAVPYYGCLLTRPLNISEAPDAENPCEIDNIISACGAESVPWSYKTDCCGGPHTLSHPELVETMSSKLLIKAVEWGADIIVTSCPMCHGSLDSTMWNMRRKKADTHLIPTLYVTELVGLCLNLEKQSQWLGCHLVDPRPLLRAKGVMR